MLPLSIQYSPSTLKEQLIIPAGIDVFELPCQSVMLAQVENMQTI